MPVERRGDANYHIVGRAPLAVALAIEKYCESARWEVMRSDAAQNVVDVRAGRYGNVPMGRIESLKGPHGEQFSIEVGINAEFTYFQGEGSGDILQLPVNNVTVDSLTRQTAEYIDALVVEHHSS